MDWLVFDVLAPFFLGVAVGIFLGYVVLPWAVTEWYRLIHRVGPDGG